MRKVCVLLFALALCFTARAQDAAPADDFGGWGDIQFNKSFSNGAFASLRAEYRCKDNWSNLDFWFLRPSVGYRFTDWLSAGLCYDYRHYPTYDKHCGLAFVTGTLKSGQLTASIREMYVRSNSNVLRSRLHVQYADPATSIKPYLAIEMFTWESWQNTRHYVGTVFPLCDNCSLDLFYLYLTRSTGTAQHVLGAGLNVTL